MSAPIRASETYSSVDIVSSGGVEMKGRGEERGSTFNS